jgi:hypothetical protein
MPSATQIYKIISKNGAVRQNLQPKPAQLHLLADLIAKNCAEGKARFDVSPYAASQWTGRTSYQIAQMIDAQRIK